MRLFTGEKAHTHRGLLNENHSSVMCNNTVTTSLFTVIIHTYGACRQTCPDSFFLIRIHTRNSEPSSQEKFTRTSHRGTQTNKPRHNSLGPFGHTTFRRAGEQ